MSVKKWIDDEMSSSIESNINVVCIWSEKIPETHTRRGFTTLGSTMIHVESDS